MSADTTLNAYELARLAEVISPDRLDSPGAEFLLRIASEVDELDEHNEDTASEIADNAVPIYTFDVWQTFVDLAAWQEDVTDFGPIEDMEQAAKVALYMIAERLVYALLEDSE